MKKPKNLHQMKKPKNLQGLAAYTLNLLQTSEEWNTDILDDIAEYAFAFDLAELDDNNMFKIKKD
jgi:hypothetical protein